MDNNNSDFLPMLSISKEKAHKNLEDAKNYITIDLKNIASILSQYHPLEIARLSVWESRKVESQSKDSFVKSTYRLLPILIQSVLVSNLFVPSSNNRDVKNKDWQRILSLSEDVARKLSRYIDNLVILNLNDGLVCREDIMDYRANVYQQFFPSEKTHDIINRERAIAEASFEWDSRKVEETFSIPPQRLVKDLYDISDKALTVIDDLVRDVSIFKDTVETKMAKIRLNDPSLSEDGARHMVYMEPDVRAENQRLTGLRDDFDLFRPEFLSAITNQTMDVLSSELGKVDILSLLFEKGLWSATCYPFIKLSGMYFTFVARYLLAIYQRFSSAVMQLDSRESACADNALSSIFTATDVVGVYSINGKKIDVEVLSPLGEINLVSEPDLWQQRMKRRSSEMEARPQLGHKMLIVNTDGEEELERLDDEIYLTSVLYLLKIKDESSLRTAFYETIFGPLSESVVEGTVFDDDVYDDEQFNVEEIENDPDELMLDELEDDEYTFDPDKEEEDEEDYPDPMEITRSEMTEEERAENERMYESNHERVVSELEKDVDNSQYTVVDEDDVVSEDEVRQDDDYEDPDQLDFLDLLDEFDEDEEEDEEEEESEDDASPSVEEDEDDVILDEDDEEAESTLSDESEEERGEEIYQESIDELEREQEAVEEEKEEIDPPTTVELEEEEEKPNVIKELDEEVKAPEGEVGDEEEVPPVKEDDAEDGVENETMQEKKDERTVSGILDFSLMEDEVSDDDPSDDAVAPEYSEPDEYQDLVVEEDEQEDDEEELPELDEIVHKDGNVDAGAGFSEQGEGKIVLEYDDGSSEDGDFLESPKYSRIIRDIARKVEGDAESLYEFLEKEDESVLEYFDKVIHDSWERQQLDGKDKMFSVFEYDMSLLLSKGMIYDDLRLQELMNNAGAVMYSKGKSRWNALLLYINSDYVVESAKMLKITRSSFSSSDWKIVTNIGDALIARKGR